MRESVNILFVEDCESTIALFQLNMERYCATENIALDVASTVSDAKQMFASEAHHAALIDWHLPDGDGTEVAEYIRAAHKTLPIIFLSASLTDDHLQKADKYDPKACLAKGHGRTYIDTIMQLILQH